MTKYFITTLLFTCLIYSNTKSQEKNVCKTKFNPRSIAYNASPDPNECWESVAYGIQIKTKQVNGFFTLPVALLETLKQKIQESEITIVVSYYEEPIEGSGEVGVVDRIWLNESLIYQNEN